VEYGGSMTEQMITDVIAYLKAEYPANSEPPEDLGDVCTDPDSPPDLDCSTGQEIFMARCAVCHGDDGEGKEDTPWYQGMALWKGDVTHLDEDQHMMTIINGRRFAFMPAFGEAPSQGVPVPPYPLTEDQIRAVMEYERSLEGPTEETTEAE
jgi:mono/diheme cytochrome c family protein